MAPYTNYLKRQDWLVEYSLGTSGPAVPKKMLELEMQRDSLHCPQSLLLDFAVFLSVGMSSSWQGQQTLLFCK